MTNSSHCILAQLIAKTEKDSVLQLENGERIHWPNEIFPATTVIGEKVRIVVETEAFSHQERIALAKNVLNELLQGSQ